MAQSSAPRFLTMRDLVKIRKDTAIHDSTRNVTVTPSSGAALSSSANRSCAILDAVFMGRDEIDLVVESRAE